MLAPERGRSFWRNIVHVVCGVATVCAIAALATRQLARTALHTVDYATRPPQEAFPGAFQHPVPAGVSDIQAAGVSRSTGSDVWLRFHATDAALALLLREGQLASNEEDRQACLLTEHLSERAPRAVGWAGVRAIASPECYILQRDTSHSRTVVVDRLRHVVYARWWDT